jgi:sterol 3beta-glucosyltransferase
MAAVVHHGGAGTTAAGLRAGVPSVILPNGLDQFAWGRRVSELGAGPSPIPRKQLTTERLAAALQAAQRPEIVASAASLGERIRAENGAESAAQIVLACLEP